ncbi:MAG: UDP-N-acetyl glucosamine 2-epimerase, partial [Nanoarchaeota archaeon]|nr:UDP-N-acetyl glucosamine 2-epimerase [Nanoarchaeota archaeon]
MKDNFIFVAGTRPELIKIAPILKLLYSKGYHPHLIHTGQHWDNSMAANIEAELGIEKPEYQLKTGEALKGGSFYERLTYMGMEVRQAIKEIQENNGHSQGIVLVQGDTLSVMAGAIASQQFEELHLGHVEAGLRSRDYRMPEEHIRIMVDHMSDVLFIPTDNALAQIQLELKEGWITGKPYVVGNTAVDITLQNAERVRKEGIGAGILQKYGLQKGDYVFMTLHRAENISDPVTLDTIMQNVLRMQNATDKRVLFSVHPNTLGKFVEYASKGYTYMLDLIPPMETYGIEDAAKLIERYPVLEKRIAAENNNYSVIPIPAVGPLECVYLQSNAAAVVTDSGGLQEECCVLGTPCITLRFNTERPVTLREYGGASVLTGNNIDRIRAEYHRAV